MPKVSWLDSVGMEANRHIAEEGAERTLCGYAFAAMFRSGIWTPYRTGRRKGDCPFCIASAKANGVNTKTWHPSVPERDISELPKSTTRLRR